MSGLKKIFIYIDVYLFAPAGSDTDDPGEKMIRYEYQVTKKKIDLNTMLAMIYLSWHNADQRDDSYEMEGNLDQIYYKKIGTDLHVHPEITN